MKRALHAIFLFAGIAATSCGPGAISGPPDLRLGRDECGECGMTIHEERSAAAVLIERDGRSEYILYDDIGCMLDAAKSGAHTVVATYVRGYSSNAWIRADSGTFLATDGSVLHTPMGSGIAAFADRDKARAAQKEFGGDVLDYAALSEWRQKQHQDRMKARQK